MMAEVARRTGCTLILCTHWLSLALPFMERLIGLRDGVVTVDCNAHEYGSEDLEEEAHSELEESISALYAGSLEVG